MIKLLDFIIRLIIGNKHQTNWKTFGKRRT